MIPQGWVWAEGDTFTVRLNNSSPHERVVRQDSEHRLRAYSLDGSPQMLIDYYSNEVFDLKHNASVEWTWYQPDSKPHRGNWQRCEHTNMLPVLLEAQKQDIKNAVIVLFQQGLDRGASGAAYRLAPGKTEAELKDERKQYLVIRAKAGKLTTDEQLEVASLIQ